MRTKINKAAATVKAEDGPHELTNITVKEVSVVDRAANQRKFLVTKNDKRATQTEDDELDLASLKPLSKTELVDTRDKAEKSGAQKTIEAKDAADKAAFEIEKARLAKEAEAVVTPAPAAATPTASAPVDAIKALDQLAAEVTPAVVPAKKDDVVTPVVVVEPAPLTPSAEKVKAAISLAIDGIADKVAQFKKAIGESDSKNTDQISGRPWAVWEYSYYIQDMLNALSRIGGADWEVASASFAKAGQPVEKANKAITAARIGVLKGVHDAINHCAGSMSKVMKELTDETPDEVVAPDASASFAKAAPVVAAPVSVAPAIDPEFVAKFAKMGETVEALRGLVQKQAIELAGKRSDISSNAISVDESKITKARSEDDNVKWEVDLAPPRNSGRRR